MEVSLPGSLRSHPTVYANSVICGGSFQHVLTWPPERLETKFSSMSGQPGLHGRTLVKTLDTKAWVSFRGWQYHVHIARHRFWNVLLSTCLGGTTGNSAVEPS